MLPYANTEAMQLHLDEISKHVSPGAVGVVLMDRARWHTTDELRMPKNVIIILIPSRSPELNPAENVWQFLRQNFLSNTVFENYDMIIDCGCKAWNKLIAMPEQITSLGSIEWAHAG
jgi:hypothetical protein